MAKDSSFDVVSEVNMQEVDNAFQQTTREISQRYDLKDSGATIELSKGDKLFTINAPADFVSKQIIDVLSAKLIKRGLPLSIESARKNINDIAGVRVVCSYIDDVYRVGEMLARQTDVEIVKKQDYIQTPNYNGYRSLHMDIKVPVYLSDRTEYVVAEIQLRTIAMDFWASLEHDIRYKVDKTKLPEGINEEMFECAGKIAEIDRQMQDMYQRIKASDAYNED